VYGLSPIAIVTVIRIYGIETKHAGRILFALTNKEDVSVQHTFNAIDPAKVGDSKTALMRPLGAFERLLHLDSVEHQRHFCIVAEIEAAKGSADYRRAFDKVQRRHALLSAAILDVPLTGPAFYRSDEQIKIVFEPLSSGPNWHEVVERELATPFVASKAPLMRATVLLGELRSIVILSLHHAIGDGLSAVYIVHDLMQALEGHDFAALALLPSMEELAAKTDGSTIEEGRAPAEVLEHMRSLAQASLWRPFKGDQPSVSSLTLSRNSTQLLRTTSRLQGTTIHGALSAAVVRSLASELDQDTISIANPINRRDHVGADEGECTLLADLEIVHFRADMPSNFWDLARHATTELSKARTNQALYDHINGLQSLLPVDADAALASGIVASMLPDVIISNLGSLPIPQGVGDTTLKSLFGPFVLGRFTNERIIGAASADGQLALVQSGPSHVSGLLPKIEEELVRACA
jgi:hypothetical protein